LVTRVCVIGSGYWGPNLVRNLDSLPGKPLYGVSDLREERLAYIKHVYPHVAVSQDYRTFLDDETVTAAVIATPAHSHFQLAREFLLRGKHTLVEKPLAMTAAQCRELIHIARQNDRVLMVGHTFEYSPAVARLKEMVQSGDLGDIYYIYSNRLNLGQIRQDVNVLWNLAPHDISIILSLLQQEPMVASAKGYSFLQEGIEDVVFLSLDFPGGTGAHIHVSWLDPGKVRRMTVVGSKKMVVYDDTNSEAPLQIYDKGVTRNGIPRDAPAFESFGEFQLLLRAGDVHIPMIPATEPLRDECAHFIDCIANGTRCRSDGLAGLRVVKVLEAAQHSLRHGSMAVPVPKED